MRLLSIPEYILIIPAYILIVSVCILPGPAYVLYIPAYILPVISIPKVQAATANQAHLRRQNQLKIICRKTTLPGAVLAKNRNFAFYFMPLDFAKSELDLLFMPITVPD